eukprot:3810594-Rhodomonas_salina.1
MSHVAASADGSVAYGSILDINGDDDDEDDDDDDDVDIGVSVPIGLRASYTISGTNVGCQAVVLTLGTVPSGGTDVG